MYKRTAVTITDDNADNTVTIDAPIVASDVDDALAGWFDDSMAEAVTELAEAIARQEPTHELAAYLGVTIETRTTYDELTDVREAAREVTTAAAELEQATAARDAILKRAVAAGASATDVARAAGIARSRLYQII